MKHLKKRTSRVLCLLLTAMMLLLVACQQLPGTSDGKEKCPGCGEEEIHARCAFCQIHTCAGKHGDCKTDAKPLTELKDGTYTLSGSYAPKSIDDKKASGYPARACTWIYTLTVEGQTGTLVLSTFSDLNLLYTSAGGSTLTSSSWAEKTTTLFTMEGSVAFENGKLTFTPTKATVHGRTEQADAEAKKSELTLYEDNTFSGVVELFFDLPLVEIATVESNTGTGEAETKHETSCPGCGEKGTEHERCEVCGILVCVGEHKHGDNTNPDPTVFSCTACGEKDIPMEEAGAHTPCRYCNVPLCVGEHDHIVPPQVRCPGCGEEDIEHDLCQYCKSYVCVGDHQHEDIAVYCPYCKLGVVAADAWRHEPCEKCGKPLCLGEHKHESDEKNICEGCKKEYTADEAELHSRCEVCGEFFCQSKDGIHEHISEDYRCPACNEMVGFNNQEDHANCEYCNQPLCVGDHDHIVPPSLRCPGCGAKDEAHYLCDVCKGYICVGDHNHEGGDITEICRYCKSEYTAENAWKHAPCDKCQKPLCMGDHSHAAETTICEACQKEYTAYEAELHSKCETCGLFFCQSGGIHVHLPETLYCTWCGKDYPFEEGEKHLFCASCNKPLCVGEHNHETTEPTACPGCGEKDMEHDLCEICKGYICVGDHRHEGSDITELCRYCKCEYTAEDAWRHTLCGECKKPLCFGEHNHETEPTACPGCGNVLENGGHHGICSYCSKYLCECGGNHTIPAITCPGCNMRGEIHEVCAACGIYVCVGDHNHEGSDVDKRICELCKTEITADNVWMHYVCDYCGKPICLYGEHTHEPEMTACPGCGNVLENGGTHEVCATCGKYTCVGDHNHNDIIIPDVICAGCRQNGVSHDKCEFCNGYVCVGTHNHGDDWADARCDYCGKSISQNPNIHWYCGVCGELICMAVGNTHTHETVTEKCSACGAMIVDGKDANGVDHTVCSYCQKHLSECGGNHDLPAITCPGCNMRGEIHEICAACGKYTCVGDHNHEGSDIDKRICELCKTEITADNVWMHYVCDYCGKPICLYGEHTHEPEMTACPGCGNVLENGGTHGICEKCGKYLCDGDHNHNDIIIPDVICAGCRQNGVSHDKCEFCNGYVCVGTHNHGDDWADARCDYCGKSINQNPNIHWYCDVCGELICMAVGNTHTHETKPTACPGCGVMFEDGSHHELCEKCGKYLCDGYHNHEDVVIPAVICAGCHQNGVSHDKCSWCGEYLCREVHEWCGKEEEVDRPTTDATTEDTAADGAASDGEN